jgi:nitric oxide synthase oxygenase domain/subunit
MSHAVEVINDLGVRLPFTFGRLLFVGVEVVDARDATQIIEGERRFVSQVTAHIEKTSGSDLDPRIDVFQIRTGDSVAKFGFE